MGKKLMYCILSGALLITSACMFDFHLSERIDNIISRIQNLNGDLDESDESDVLTSAWQEDIDQLRHLLKSQSIPEHFLVDDPILMGGEFDLMSIFDILDHIRMEEGYKLAYVYHYDFMGGYPIVYAYDIEAEPFMSHQEYLTGRAECLAVDDALPGCSALDHVETDGSDLGYLQLVLLDLMGSQFYRYWHAQYNDTTPIATQTALEEMIASVSDPYIPLTNQEVRKAKAINPIPKVTIGEAVIKVRVVWFTKWGGFYESKFEIEKAFPHTITQDSTENLLEYDCGLMF
jgi:hypothetical protein